MNHSEERLSAHGQGARLQFSPSEAMGNEHDEPLPVNMTFVNVLPESIRERPDSSWQGSEERARRRAGARRTSDAMSNAARADQGLPADPG